MESAKTRPNLLNTKKIYPMARFFWREWMRLFITLLFGLIISGDIMAQADSSLSVPKDSPAKDAQYYGKVYRMHPKYQLPVAGAAIVLSTMGFHALDENARLKDADVMKLNANDVNSFDRRTAVRDPSGFANAASKGDFLLNFSVASPLLLGLDKHMRKDWVDLLTLYMASQAFDNMLYFGAIATVRRPRPIAYNTGLSLAERTGIGMSKSFFSGHVSFSATATFFAMKTYTDYHRIKGWSRVLLYGIAAVPPLTVGYFRVESGRHFKSDVIVGLLAGATSGILVPELFRNKDKRKGLSLTPFYMQDGGGVSLAMRL